MRNALEAFECVIQWRSSELGISPEELVYVFVNKLLIMPEYWRRFYQVYQVGNFLVVPQSHIPADFTGSYETLMSTRAVVMGLNMVLVKSLGLEEIIAVMKKLWPQHPFPIYLYHGDDWYERWVPEDRFPTLVRHEQIPAWHEIQNGAHKGSFQGAKTVYLMRENTKK